MNFSLFLTAFLTGLYGSGHCVGMCGPIISVLGLNTQYKQLTAAFFYNLGRISSYMLLGFIAALFTLAVGDLKPVQLILRYLAASMMILFALQLLGVPQLMVIIERPTRIFGQKIAQHTQRLLPIRSAAGAYFIGIIWGFFPCGMVYMAFTLSLTSTTPYSAPLVMLSFGLGTLPVMIALACFSNYFGYWLHHRNARRLAGLLILLMTIFYLITTTWPADHTQKQQTGHSSRHTQNVSYTRYSYIA